MRSSSRQAVLAVDIGTSSSKGVLVGTDGRLLGTAVRPHSVDRPAPGQVEMDGWTWWEEFVGLSRELTAGAPEAEVVAVGVSGMGPCVLLADADGAPVRRAILYGVDTRATEQIAAMTERLGAEEILARCGSALSTQAVGPKIAWVAEHEPEAYARARMLFMPSSWLAYRLTGEYMLDHHSASQSAPLYDSSAAQWHTPWAAQAAPGIDLPRLAWPQETAGAVTPEAARATGLPAGIPVITGTIDAWSEAVSADAQNVGDLMIMYGSTMFLVNTVPQRLTSPTLWGTAGAFEGTSSLAGGLATSGALTAWMKDLFGSADYPELLAEAAISPPGSRGLLVLPHFAGERTPINDPHARGLIAGLTLSHSRGDLYRAALEATALGVRHNIAAMREAGGQIDRAVAVGGGTQGGLWTQIVSDVTGLPQTIPSVTIGASYGAAYLAARAAGVEADIAAWNPPAGEVTPSPAASAHYDELFQLYQQSYAATAEISHALAARQAASD
ncbi:FGGY-family carbohydrate kinase [Sinomonas sp. G460-2]|uniref:FGGY-family carbohydrate kinase n=1 Tax=Sinomonas sp. G460-2 TaxID=3393464 RepID=UPI0039F05C8A